MDSHTITTNINRDMKTLKDHKTHSYIAGFIVGFMVGAVMMTIMVTLILKPS